MERAYSRRLYASWQPAVTSASNLVPWAAIDAMALAVAAFAAWQVARPFRARARGRRGRAAVGGALALATLAAALAAWFLLSWGLNYRRLPLASQLDHDRSRVDVEAVSRVATLAVERLNALHGAAHAVPWPDDERLREELATSFAESLRLLGLPDGVVAGRSKSTLFGPYFEAAAISGFTNPWALDVIVTPGALPMERPALLLHEWAHLAGLAHEAEAGFLGWMTGMRGSEQSRYSAWLELLPRLGATLPPERRKAVYAGLAEGPLADYRAIEERLRRARPAVRQAAWSGYGRFLEANTVAGGLASYDQVVDLVVGTSFDEQWRPRRRQDAGR